MSRCGFAQGDLMLDILEAQENVIARAARVDAIRRDAPWQHATRLRDDLDDAVRELRRLEPLADWNER